MKQKKTAIKCEHCPHEAIHANPIVAKRMMGMHMHHKHPKEWAASRKDMPKKSAKASRMPAPAQADKSSVEVASPLNFCPCCGTNLFLVVAALRRSQR